MYKSIVVALYALWFVYQVSTDPMPFEGFRAANGTQAINFTGGGQGSGAGTANGSAAGADPNGTATASVIVGSLGSAAGGSYLQVDATGGVNSGSYGTGTGTGGGSADAGGSNATATLDTSGTASGNGSGQNAQVSNSTRQGRFFFPYGGVYGGIGGLGYGYGGYPYGGYGYGYRSPYFGSYLYGKK